MNLERTQSKSLAKKSGTIVKVGGISIAAIVALKIGLLIIGVVGTLLTVAVPLAIMALLILIVYHLFFKKYE